MVWVEKDTKAKEVNTAPSFITLLSLDQSQLLHCLHTQVTHLPMPNIKKISCGPNHTVAVDENNKVDAKIQSPSIQSKLDTRLQAFSWGFGGYGRLGHSETADELVRRSC